MAMWHPFWAEIMPDSAERRCRVVNFDGPRSAYGVDGSSYSPGKAEIVCKVDL